MAQIDNLRIEWVELSEIVRWSRNPKDHDLGLIYQSISRFGFVQPILVDETTGQLVAGHGRLDTLLMKRTNSEKAPAGIKVEGDNWFVPVIRGISFKDEHEAEAYVVADNRTVEQGGWIEDKLAEVLQDHVGDLRGIGFDRADIDELVKNITPDVDDDEFLIPPEIEFTAELLEEHNYLVFTFDKSFDWNVVAEHFSLGTVHALDSEGTYERKGVGRVLDGSRLLEVLGV